MKGASARSRNGSPSSPAGVSAPIPTAGAGQKLAGRPRGRGPGRPPAQGRCTFGRGRRWVGGAQWPHGERARLRRRARRDRTYYGTTPPCRKGPTPRDPAAERTDRTAGGGRVAARHGGGRRGGLGAVVAGGGAGGLGRDVARLPGGDLVGGRAEVRSGHQSARGD